VELNITKKSLKKIKVILIDAQNLKPRRHASCAKRCVTKELIFPIVTFDI